MVEVRQAQGPAAPWSDPSGNDGTERRRHLVEAIACRLGSLQEARWIVDHGGEEEALALADRRAAGEPLQYVLGRWPFRSVDLLVDPRVLIPRPETEQVVEVALAEFGGVVADRGPALARLAADLGTGSGAIGLSLAVEGGRIDADLEVWATDVSMEALAVARQNLADLAGEDPEAARRVNLAHGDWFGALPQGLAGQFDLVVANPPYVAEEEFPELEPVVREWEPRSALVAGSGRGGVGGMAAIETIVGNAPRWLHGSGVLVVEIAPDQAEPATALARRVGFTDVTTAVDLAGRVRMLVART